MNLSFRGKYTQIQSAKIISPIAPTIPNTSSKLLELREEDELAEELCEDEFEDEDPDDGRELISVLLLKSYGQVPP